MAGIDDGAAEIGPRARRLASREKVGYGNGAVSVASLNSTMPALADEQWLEAETERARRVRIYQAWVERHGKLGNCQEILRAVERGEFVPPPLDPEKTCTRCMVRERSPLRGAPVLEGEMTLCAECRSSLRESARRKSGEEEQS